jgi:hypothetical protein
VAKRTSARPRRLESGAQLCLSVGGIRIAVETDDPDLALGASGAADPFLEASAEPDVVVRAVRRTPPRRDLGEPVFDSGGAWRLYRDGPGWSFELSSPAIGPRPYQTARFDREFRRGEIWLDPVVFPAGQPVNPLLYPLDELLVVNLLARGRGVEVHACGLRDRDGTGLLFVGQSGAGKTTMARLWESEEGIRVLSDDRIVLRAGEGRVFMHGTPWHGEAGLAAPDRVPLDQVYVLRQATAERLVPLGPAEAAARLFATSFAPFHSPSGLSFTLKVLDRVARGTACAELHFRRDRAVIDFLRASRI